MALTTHIRSFLKNGLTPPVVVSLTFVLVYAISFINAFPLFNDPDAAMHIIMGDTIRRAGHIPATNLWSFVVPDQKAYVIAWLWDVMISLIHWVGGTKAVFMSTQVQVALTMALIALHVSKRKGISSAVIVFTAVLAGMCFHKFIMSRPQLGGYLLVALFHFRLNQSRDDFNFRHMLWLPALMLVWVNAHGSFPVAFAMFSAYMMEAAWHKQWRWLIRLSVIAGICLVMIPLNPYGFDIYNAVTSSLHSVMNQFIEEWTPLKFGNDFGISLWLALFFLLLMLSNFRVSAVPLADKLLCAICLLPMLESNRNSSIFILVSVPYMATNLQSFVDVAERWHGNLKKYVQWPETPALRIGMASLVVVTIAISGVLTDLLRSDSYLVSPEFDSRPAIAWVREHMAGRRLLNDYNFGGLIIYESKGAFPVFVDGRAGTAYPERFLADYEIFEQFYKDWAAVLDKYRIDAVFVQNARPFAALYANGAKYDDWELVYRDRVASVFVRKQAQPAEGK